MKAGTHPSYTATAVSCRCGAHFAMAGTAGTSVQVDVCSSCHPFFTGRQRVLDTGGRVARFARRYPAGEDFMS